MYIRYSTLSQAQGGKSDKVNSYLPLIAKFDANISKIILLNFLSHCGISREAKLNKNL